MILTITPGPQEFDTSGYIDDAQEIARAVEKVGACRGWRVTQVQVFDELEGAILHVDTNQDEESDDAQV